MRGRLLIFVTSCVFALFASPVNAGPTLNLSSPTDLTKITVGQTVEIDVSLSALAVGSDFIFVLNSQVLFASSLFTPVADPFNSSGLKPGAGFFFDPSQIANFNALSSLGAGTATGDFSDNSPNSSFAINQNGLYYSFLLKAQAVGTGVISFNAVNTNYAASDTGFNLAPFGVLGSPLAYTITPAPAPEPASLAMVASGLAALMCWTRARRRAVR